MPDVDKTLIRLKRISNKTMEMGRDIGHAALQERSGGERWF
jgi:hypothetical protein